MLRVLLLLQATLLTNAFTPSVLPRSRVALRSFHQTHPLQAVVSAAKPAPTPVAASWRKPDIGSGERYDTGDWLYLLSSTLRSTILKRIAGRLTFNMLLAVCVAYIHIIKGFSMSIPMVPVSLAGSVLGLLLAFRTNSAYDRYWEARKVWGSVMNTVRNMAAMSKIFMLGNSDKMLTLLHLFPHVLAVHLQGGYGKTLPHDQASLVLASQFGEKMHDKLKDVNCPPNYLTYKMRELVSSPRNSPPNVLSLAHELNFNEKVNQLVDDLGLNVMEVAHEILFNEKMNQLVDDLGKCERLLKTPIPLSYSHHVSRFNSLWCGALPFVMVGTLGWGMVPSVAVVSWALMAVEEIGHAIENPFNTMDIGRLNGVGRDTPFHKSLPLSAIGTTIGGEALDTLNKYD